MPTLCGAMQPEVLHQEDLPECSQATLIVFAKIGELRNYFGKTLKTDTNDPKVLKKVQELHEHIAQCKACTNCREALICQPQTTSGATSDSIIFADEHWS